MPKKANFPEEKGALNSSAQGLKPSGKVAVGEPGGDEAERCRAGLCL